MIFGVDGADSNEDSMGSDVGNIYKTTYRTTAYMPAETAPLTIALPLPVAPQGCNPNPSLATFGPCSSMQTLMENVPRRQRVLWCGAAHSGDITLITLSPIRYASRHTGHESPSNLDPASTSTSGSSSTSGRDMGLFVTRFANHSPPLRKKMR